MGNTESNVTSGVKKQADTSSILMYKLVDLNGNIKLCSKLNFLSYINRQKSKADSYIEKKKNEQK